jgi:hypothetical protein
MLLELERKGGEGRDMGNLERGQGALATAVAQHSIEVQRVQMMAHLGQSRAWVARRRPGFAATMVCELQRGL